MGKTTINLLVEDIMNYRSKDVPEIRAYTDDLEKKHTERREKGTNYLLRQIIDYFKLGGFYR